MMADDLFGQATGQKVGLESLTHKCETPIQLSGCHFGREV